MKELFELTKQCHGKCNGVINFNWKLKHEKRWCESDSRNFDWQSKMEVEENVLTFTEFKMEKTSFKCAVSDETCV